MAVALSSYLIPSNGGKFFLLEDVYLRGGFRIVPNVAARDALHMSVKKARMVVITADDGKVWQLQSNNRSWEEFRTKTTYFPFYTHDQLEPSMEWAIAHGMASKYFSYTIFDGDGVQVMPDQVHIVDDDTVRVVFNIPILGHATLSFAVQS